jgi:prepilin-type N-terminal cleavage/methylation domain-containing protein
MNRRLIQCRRQPGRAGFTLLEILVASMIVAMLMLIIGRIFVDANRVYELGTKDMDINAEARAVLEFMAQELANAPAENGRLALCVDKDADDPNNSDELFFMTLNGDPSTTDTNRAVYQVRYATEERTNSMGQIFYNLRRADRHIQPACYRTPPLDWWSRNLNAEFNNFTYRTLIANVFQLDFHYMVYDGAGGFEEIDVSGHGRSGSGANSLQDEYPDFIDITLGVMSENDMRRWALLYDPDDDTAQKEYEERFGKVFRARVFLHSAYGYDMMTR